MIDCKSIAAEIKENLKPLVSENKKLAIIQVGSNPASDIYVRNKIKDCEELNIPIEKYNFDANTGLNLIKDKIKELNEESVIKGIIVQLPLEGEYNKEDIDDILNTIADEKDVDGFKPTSKYIPATPKGILTILNKVEVTLENMNVLLIGKGKTTNMPLIPLLLEQGANVTIIHSKTSEYEKNEAIKNADIIITAVGKPDTLNVKNMSAKRKTIIDVGISRIDGKQVGDCSKELHNPFANITPWTNGVGLMTRVSLLQNLLEE